MMLSNPFCWASKMSTVARPYMPIPLRMSTTGETARCCDTAVSESEKKPVIPQKTAVASSRLSK